MFEFDQPAMFNYDITIVVLVLIVGLFIKSIFIRNFMWGLGFVYLFASLAWHGIFQYYLF